MADEENEEGAIYSPLQKQHEDLKNARMCLDLDHAFLGLWYPNFEDRANSDRRPVAVYSIQKIVEGYVKDGMTEEEAEEFFYFNVEDAWVQDRPIFIDEENWKFT